MVQVSAQDVRTFSPSLLRVRAGKYCGCRIYIYIYTYYIPVYIHIYTHACMHVRAGKYCGCRDTARDDFEAFKDDLLLIGTNCTTYNADDDTYVKLGHKFKESVERLCAGKWELIQQRALELQVHRGRR